MIRSPQEEVWVGLANVRPRPGNQYVQDKGAFVNVLAFAADKVTYINRIKKALDELDFDLVDIEDVEPFRIRTANHEVDETLKAAAAEAEREKGVAFGVFHSYENDDSAELD
jgi:hypothetical protein